jgi:RNA polymerase sigma factor (sigma-70 family)
MARLLQEALPFPWRSDHELVTAVRNGDESAFEQLFIRYRGRIWSFVSGILGDPDRADDISQEVFISVLRRLRETERPIVFKPWIYQIARNACIDELRRTRRTPEVPLAEEEESHDGLDGMLSTTPGADLTAERKQRLEDLRGAFRGVSKVHHRILVLRELEGLSYSEIGQRLGMSRPMVESTLFRARRRLAEEYEELISGRRCEHTRTVIDASEGRTLRRLGVRETRRLARHLGHCRPCRRYAALARAAGSGLSELPVAGAVARSTADGAPEHIAGRPIALASRRRPAAEDAALSASGPDSLAVA